MNYFNKEIWIFYEYSISNLAFIASKEFFVLQNKKTLHQLRYKVSHAEDGTWTHTSAMLTRSLVLLVCQFRHFRISHFCYKFYLLLRQLVLYQKLYKLSIAFLNFFLFFCKNYHFYVFLSFLLSIDSKIIYNRKSICNCLFHSKLLFTPFTVT